MSSQAHAGGLRSRKSEPAQSGRKAGRKPAVRAAEAMGALQQSAGNAAVSGLLSGGEGAPMPPALRRDMEQRFGHDFSAVRLHDDPRAADLAASLSAKAFTVGPHIAFSRGRFAPDTRDGKRLLSHELAHVVQQSRGSAMQPSLDGAGPLEGEAVQAGEAAANGAGAVAVASGSAVGPAAEPEASWYERAKQGLSSAADAVRPGGSVFEAVDNVVNPSKENHPALAAVMDNLDKRGKGLVEGTVTKLKETGEDIGDITYYATHVGEPGAVGKLSAAVQRRATAPVDEAVGMAKGFGQMVKRVGEAGGDIAYYATHSDEAGASAKIASGVTDIVLDAPQIVLTVEGAAGLAKGAAGAMGRNGPTPPEMPPPREPPVQRPPPRAPMKETIEMRPLAAKGEALGDPTVPATPGEPVKVISTKDGLFKGAGKPERPDNYIRVMKGDPAASLDYQQKPYVHLSKGGKPVGSAGTNVVKGSPEAHIPFSDWSKWKQPFEPGPT